jgi:excinuclease UvrABC helicase subunit UvrB
MKKINKEKHRNKMAKLRRKMLKAWATKKNEKAAKLRQKIIEKTLKHRKDNE